jgi:hypothetical protein
MINPENLLTNASFQLIIKSIDDAVYHGKSINLPSVSMGTIEYSTPEVDIQLAGEKLIYAALNLNFLVDDELNNWQRIFDWMLECTKVDYIDDISCDATIIIYNRDNKAVKYIDFTSCIPISLGDIQFNVNEGDVDTMCNITLEYDLFTIRDK